MGDVIFKGDPVRREDILRAMRDFDALYQNTADCDDWLDKQSYKFAVRHGGKLYPPKLILSLATGVARTEFSGGDQTNNVLRELDFEVGDKWQMIPEL